MSTSRQPSTVFAFLLLATAATAEERLVLVGGGDRPAAAMTRFVQWAGGSAARILVVPWASSEPKGSYKALRDDLALLGPAVIEMAPLAPLTDAKRAELLEKLGRATGVFFGGGDQARIMAVLRDGGLLQAMRARHQGGVVFGGTSAGTAVMSARMITGEGDFSVLDGDKVEVRPGLGLLPGVILDQHFLKRRRQNRLFGLVLKHPEERGVGIDEGAALLVQGHEAEVVGGAVMLVDARTEPGTLLVTVVPAGGHIDLARRP
ncbi:MAG: cyanophycinase [Solirubrobacterales bacterium]|jgi:cyanophycinase